MFGSYQRKVFQELNGNVEGQLQGCLVRRGRIPAWTVEVRTVLVVKDVKKGNVASN